MQRSSPDIEAQSRGRVRKQTRRSSRRPSTNSWHQDRVDDKDPNPPKYGDTSASYWKLYGSEAETSDKNLVESLMGNTSSMVFLNSLFSSIVASFIIEIYKTLVPGNNPAILPSTALRINIALFFSFFLSVGCAVSCALIQQWCSEYLKFSCPRAAPHDRGRVRTYLYQGLDYFQMRRFMYGTHVVLHVSVFLFFWALSDFFYTVHHIFGLAARYGLVAAASLYIILSISPLMFSNSPYNTPMTPPLRTAFIILRIIIRSPLLCMRYCRSEPFDLTGLEYYKGIHFDRARLYSMEAKERAEKLEPYAMEWLFTENDFSDNDMSKFLESLPGYMSSSHTDKGRLDRYLTADHILTRIKEHFITCATSVELPDEVSCGRVSSSVKALRHIFQYSRERKEKSPVPGELKKEFHLQREYIQGLMDDFQTLCGMDDPTIALRASCIRALAVQGLLSDLVLPDSRTTVAPRFPVSLLPIYTFFFPYDNTETIRQLDDGLSPSAIEIGRMWNTLLHEGPLANLTKFAQAVRDKEHAPPSSFSLCWKAFDILLARLGTIHSKESTRAYGAFDDLRKSTRTHVHKQLGFRVAPLLDILDTVARGRRLLMVFSGNPKYQNRADVAFGKEHLRNSDLLEAFAHCLPDFISNNKGSPNVCKKLMEEVVRHDDLWISLQVNLWNTQRSDSPIPDKFRVFEDCCIVIDLAFSVLEDSQNVDWRAPEFGSLAQHFESFITHYFQSAFMGRATSFRVGVIKARFCKALLTQFWNDIDHEGTVSFRSQWDVASLARLIYTLGLRDKADPEFWSSYVDGGHIGADFTAKALEMINITARDGPLLLFCQLGHLIATALPLDQSGLTPTDIEKVRELQGKVIDDKRLSWQRASDMVWNELSQLRQQVNELCGKYTGEDSKILQGLLRTVDDVHNLRFTGPESPSQSQPAEEQGPNASVPVHLTSFSGESPMISNRISFASESTAVSGGPSSGTETSEGEDSFGQYGPLPSSRPTVQRLPSVRIMDRSSTFLSTISPVVPYYPNIGGVRPRMYTSPRRTGSGFTPTRPSPIIRASYGSFDLSDEGQSGAGLTSEPEELDYESSGSPGRP